MTTRILNPGSVVRNLEGILIDAAESVVAGLDGAFTEKLASPEYDWPRPTVRSNGRTVTSPRNIIDTGELEGSQRLARISRVEWLWDWRAGHALINHEGGTLRNGTDYPARRWTARAVQSYKPAEKFVAEVRRRV
jgi:hypothetical protein